MEPSPNWYERYNASRILALRVRTTDRPGMLASVLNAIATEACQLGGVIVPDLGDVAAAPPPVAK